MILSFKQDFPWGAPTGFEDKILAGKKIHTIRADKSDRWQPGLLIHFATGVRTKNYNQFYQDVCYSTQHIEIEPDQPRSANPGIDFGYSPLVVVDSRVLDAGEASRLAQNDGFDRWEDFARWFSDPFEGKLIHWTTIKY